MKTKAIVVACLCLVASLKVVSADNVFLTTTVSNGDICFSFNTVSNQSYSLEYKNDLAWLNWSNFITVNGDGTLQTFCDLLNQTSRFYRVTYPVSTTDFSFLYVAPEFNSSIGNPGGCGCTSPGGPNAGPGAGNSQDNAMGNVFLHTGELEQRCTDLLIPGRGFDFKVKRIYRSGMNYHGPFGHGWDCNLNRRLHVESNGDVLRVDGEGRVDRYVKAGNTFFSPSGFYTTLSNLNNGTFQERNEHGFIWLYGPTNSNGIAQIMSMTDRNQNAMTFHYASSHQLTSVTDTLNRLITFQYDNNGHLTIVTDFTGRSVQYGYDANDDLRTERCPIVTGTPNGNDFPQGKTTSYTYASGFGDDRFNHNLLTVTAPNEAGGGPPRLVAQYDFNPVSSNADRLVSVQLGGTNNSGVGAGGTIFFVYSNLSSVVSNDYITAIFQNIVSNRNGNVTQYQFNQLGNIVDTRQFTRGIHAGDPAFFEYQFQYNADGELTQRINPAGDSVQNIFDSSNPDRFQQGNLLQTTFFPGPRGGDQSQIVTSKTYDPRFNFVGSVTDGRGNVKHYFYDSQGNLTNLTERDPATVDNYEYNQFGQLTAHVLPDDGTGYRRRDTTTYYLTGAQAGYIDQQIIDDLNAQLTTRYEHDALGNITRVIDPRGNDSLFTFNALNEVVREQSRPVTTPAGPVRYTRDTYYDANENIFRIDLQNVDDSGQVVSANPTITTSHLFDILDEEIQRAEEVDASHNILEGFSYDPNGNQTIVRSGEAMNGNQPNNYVQTVYDERDLVFRLFRAPLDPGHSTRQFDYDLNGNLTKTAAGTEDAGGQVTTSIYDGFDRRIGEIDPMGNILTLHYDANGNVLSQQLSGELVDVPGSAGNTTLWSKSWIYDILDRRTTEDELFFDTTTGLNIGSGHAIRSWTFAPNSLLLTHTDANSNATAYAYDTASRTSLITDPKGNTTAFTYDNDGNIIFKTVTDLSDLGHPPQVFTQQSEWDGLGRQRTETDSAGNVFQQFYDSRNNVTLTIDGRGDLTRKYYDGRSRLIEERRDMNGNGVFTDASDISVSQTWDDNSRVIARIDANRYATRSTYDVLDRLLATQHPDGTVDQVGSGIIWPLGGQPNLTGFIPGYDVHDNKVKVTDARGTATTSTYDLDNRLLSTFIARATGVVGTTNESYQWDGVGRVVSAVDDDSKVTRSYDSLSRVTTELQQNLPGGTIRTNKATYDAVGNQTSLKYPSGLNIVRTFDALHHPKSVNTSPTGTLFPFISLYDYIGDRMEDRQYGSGINSYFNYDGLDGVPNAPGDFGAEKLSSIVHSNKNSAAVVASLTALWDPNQNLAQWYNVQLPDTRTYNFDADDRLTNSTSSADARTNKYVYDANGNRVTVISNGVAGNYTMNSTLPEPGDAQENQYTTTPFDNRGYDQDGNTTNTTTPNFVTRTYAYDFRGQVVTISDSDTGTIASYQYDALGRRISKTANGVLTRVYFDGNEEIEERNSTGTLTATYVYSKGPDRRIEMQRGISTYFFLTDFQDSVINVMDANNNVAETDRYEDFGNPILPQSAAYGQSPNQVTGDVSDIDPAPFTAPTNCADNFTITQAVTVVAFDWWGSYIGTPAIIDNFIGVIYTNNGSIPGPIMTTIPVSFSRLTRVTTGQTVQGQAEYHYTLQLAQPIALQSGSYWFGIANDVTGASAWQWESSAQGNGLHVAATNFSGPFNAAPGNLAFIVTVIRSFINPFGFGGNRYDPESGFYAAGGTAEYDPKVGRDIHRIDSFFDVFAEVNIDNPTTPPIPQAPNLDVPTTPAKETAQPPNNAQQPPVNAPAKEKCCVDKFDKVRPTRHIATHGESHALEFPFSIHATFKDKPPPCKCKCCEYRQFVRGTETRDDVDVTPRAPGGVNQITKDKDVEDYGFASSTGHGYKKGDLQRYGHRDAPNTGDNQYCKGGCEYKGKDAPYVPFAPGSSVSIDLHFTGQIIDVCNDGKVVASQSWDARGSSSGE